MLLLLLLLCRRARLAVGEECGYPTGKRREKNVARQSRQRRRRRAGDDGRSRDGDPGEDSVSGWREGGDRKGEATKDRRREGGRVFGVSGRQTETGERRLWRTEREGVGGEAGAVSLGPIMSVGEQADRPWAVLLLLLLLLLLFSLRTALQPPAQLSLSFFFLLSAAAPSPSPSPYPHGADCLVGPSPAQSSSVVDNASSTVAAAGVACSWRQAQTTGRIGRLFRHVDHTCTVCIILYCPSTSEDGTSGRPSSQARKTVIILYYIPSKGRALIKTSNLIGPRRTQGHVASALTRISPRDDPTTFAASPIFPRRSKQQPSASHIPQSWFCGPPPPSPIPSLPSHRVRVKHTCSCTVQ
ncbi:hypothetical protein IWX50DRAFT_707947 [Phyllosticta citricarpa]|uniref:Uncharacterized protein n=1 Tax=Phyllosticta citricarpa TaxID=55181 RepID=A0ABR1MJQ6_9PEZI